MEWEWHLSACMWKMYDQSWLILQWPQRPHTLASLSVWCSHGRRQKCGCGSHNHCHLARGWSLSNAVVMVCISLGKSLRGAKEWDPHTCDQGTWRLGQCSSHERSNLPMGALFSACSSVFLLHRWWKSYYFIDLGGEIDSSVSTNKLLVKEW